MLTRVLRHARGYEERLAGRPEGYLAFCRSELERYRRLGAVAESWQVAQGQMLAEHDRGATDVALGVGAAALEEIRAAGRLRQHAPLLALWLTMLVQAGDIARSRPALAEALPTLPAFDAVDAGVRAAFIALLRGPAPVEMLKRLARLGVLGRWIPAFPFPGHCRHGAAHPPARHGAVHPPTRHGAARLSRACR